MHQGGSQWRRGWATASRSVGNLRRALGRCMTRRRQVSVGVAVFVLCCVVAWLPVFIGSGRQGGGVASVPDAASSPSSAVPGGKLSELAPTPPANSNSDLPLPVTKRPPQTRKIAPETPSTWRCWPLEHDDAAEMVDVLGQPRYCRASRARCLQSVRVRVCGKGG